MMDFSFHPPKAYILSANWEYKLQTDLPQLPNTWDILEKRRELQEIRFKLQEIEKLEQEYERLKWKENKTPEEQKRFEELDKNVETIKGKKKELIAKAEELRKALLSVKFDPKEKQRLTEKQQKQEKTLSLFHSTWFDLIPQEITDTIIYEINLSEKWVIDLWWWKRFQENINLKEGKFWQGFWENEEEIFLRFFNKLISGNP